MASLVLEIPRVPVLDYKSRRVCVSVKQTYFNTKQFTYNKSNSLSTSTARHSHRVGVPNSAARTSTSLERTRTSRGGPVAGQEVHSTCILHGWKAKTAAPAPAALAPAAPEAPADDAIGELVNRLMESSDGGP